MGIDHGTRRVGIALSDRLGITAHPYQVLPAGHALTMIARIAVDEEVERIVVGLPVGLSGREGTSAKQARAFAAEVAATTRLPVELWDERLTSHTAENALEEAGVKRRRRRITVDKVAAAIMLQSFLDSR